MSACVCVLRIFSTIAITVCAYNRTQSCNTRVVLLECVIFAKAVANGHTTVNIKRKIYGEYARTRALTLEAEKMVIPQHNSDGLV